MGKLSLSELRRWGQRNRISIAQAAYLWVGEQPEPCHRVSQKGNAHATFGTLKEHIWEKQGKSPRYPNGPDFLPVAEFRHIADELGERPAFLYPDEHRQHRRAAPSPKQETIENWKSDYDQVEHHRLQRNTTLGAAVRIAAEGTGRTHAAFEANHRRYRGYLEQQKNKND